MFVLNSTYQKELKARLELTIAFNHLQTKWNNLVDRINDKGGEEFLESDPSKNKLSKEELTKLISLCHPDKHDGKASATIMTKKLLKLREQI